MENIDAEVVQDLIAEYRNNQKIAADARARNRDILDFVGDGRTDGLEEYFSVTPASRGSRYDAFLLRKYVPQATLDRCRVGFKKARTATIRAIKAKAPKKEASHELA